MQSQVFFNGQKTQPAGIIEPIEDTLIPLGHWVFGLESFLVCKTNFLPSNKEDQANSALKHKLCEEIV